MQRLTERHWTCPLLQALRPGRDIRLETPQGPMWLVRGPREKQTRVARGCSIAQVWTYAELAALPWSGPLTLERVAVTFTMGLTHAESQP